VFVPFIISSRCNAPADFHRLRAAVFENFEQFTLCFCNHNPYLSLTAADNSLRVRPQLLRCASSRLLKNEVLRTAACAPAGARLEPVDSMQSRF